MQRRVILAAVAAVALAAGPLAQAKPSFAGKWTLVADPNAAPAGGRGGRGMGFGGLGQAFTAAQDEKTLTVTTSSPQLGEMKSVYNLDGSPSHNPLNMGGNSIDRTSVAKWDGNKLVISTTTGFGGQSIESTQTWSLDEAGNLVVESTSSMGGGAVTKATYKKG